MSEEFVPSTPHSMTAEWLTTVLAPRFPGVRVSDVEVVEVRQVTHTHAFFRIDYAVSAGAPERMFAKMPPLDPDRRQVIMASRMSEREVLFYEHLAPHVAFRLPDVYVARYDDRDQSFIILMEDLSAAGCLISDGTWGISSDSAARALEELAALHVRFEDPSRRLAEAPWVPEAKHGGPVGLTSLQFGLDHHRGRLTDQFAQITEIYLERYADLVQRWASGPGPVTVVHGDGHIGNLFVDPADRDRTGFLDWGVINVTTPIRDAGYFINMALAVDDRRCHDVDLMRHYLDVRQKIGGAPIGFDDAWQAHRLHAAYMIPAACQIVTFPPDATERRKVFAAGFLERVHAALDDLDTRGAIREQMGM